MKKVMSIAMVTLMAIGSSVYACDTCGCKAKKEASVTSSCCKAKKEAKVVATNACSKAACDTKAECKKTECQKAECKKTECKKPASE